MFFFNFIGVAFSLAGMLVGGGLWFLFGRWFGDSWQSLAGGFMLGSLFTAFLDLRYRWLGELNPEPIAADPSPETRPNDDVKIAKMDPKPSASRAGDPKASDSFAGQLTTASLTFAQRCWNVVWPFAGGHVLWIPVWAPAFFFFTAYFLGYLSWIFPGAKS